jgi:gliding motility-associated-like protein
MVTEFNYLWGAKTENKKYKQQTIIMSKFYLVLFAITLVLNVNKTNAQQSLTPFNCPQMAGIVSEGPSTPDKPSYLSTIDASTGSFSGLIGIEDTLTGAPMLSLNGFGIVSTTGMGYAQYQRVPTRTEVLESLLLTGNYISNSKLIEIGSNGKAVELGTLMAPVNTGYNLHGMIGLIGTADNSGNYIVAAGELQYNASTMSADSFKLYIGRIAVPSTTIVWSEVMLDASCTAFQQGFIDAITIGNDAGAQDMVWSPSTNEILLYSGVDRVLGVIGTDNVGRCYQADASVPVLSNLGGLALDSIGQMIALEVGTGKVWRIDTRGCLDGNPATPCGVTSVSDIAQFSVNDNTNTRGDAASCVASCNAPVIDKKSLMLTLCKDSINKISINVISENLPLTYVWGLNEGNGVLTDSNTANPTYINDADGKYKLYVTVTDNKGCQTSDSIDVTIKTCYVCDSVILIDSVVNIKCDSENKTTPYCMPFSGDVSLYNFYLNNNSVNPERCGYDTLVSYSFITAYTAGYLNNQNHILDSIRINDQLFGPYTYTTVETLVDIFNTIDATGNWTSPNDSALIGGTPANIYGDIYVTRADDNFKHIIFNQSVEIPSGLEFQLPSACNWILAEDKKTLCRDSVQVCVYCDEFDTIYRTLVEHTDSVICVRIPVGDETTTTTLCNSSTTGEFGAWVLANNCITYSATNVGSADTICVNACNATTNQCINTIIIIDVIAAKIDTLYEELVVNDSLFVCDELAKPAGENLTYKTCNTNNINIGAVSFEDDCLKYIAGANKGNDTICISVCNDKNICSTTVVILKVVGNPPIAINNDTISYGNPVVISVLNNDINTDGDQIALCGGNNGIIVSPSNGTTNITQSNISYTPNQGFSGIDSFSYAICDEDGADTAWVYITVEDCTIPNTFSPDGNGKNDTYYIPCAVGKEVQLCIFNRWGIEVFRSEKYDNAWDGTYRGKLLPDGTYYYTLKYTNNAGNNIDRAGFVVINRIK